MFVSIYKIKIFSFSSFLYIIYFYIIPSYFYWFFPIRYGILIFHVKDTEQLKIESHPPHIHQEVHTERKPMFKSFFQQPHLQGKELWISLALYITGMIAIGMGAVLTVNSHAGAGGYDALTFVLSDRWNMPVSYSIYLIAVISVLFAAIIRRKFPRVTTFITAFLLGGAVDFFRIYLAPIQGKDIFSTLAILAFGLILIGFGVAAYLLSKFPANPIDDFVLAIHEKNIPLQYAKLAFDIPCFVLAYLLGGKIGWGSIVITLALGPIIQLWSRLLSKILSQYAMARN